MSYQNRPLSLRPKGNTFILPSLIFRTCTNARSEGTPNDSPNKCKHVRQERRQCKEGTNPTNKANASLTKAKNAIRPIRPITTRRKCTTKAHGTTSNKENTTCNNRIPRNRSSNFPSLYQETLATRQKSNKPYTMYKGRFNRYKKFTSRP